jgi:hypothetical protein
MTTRPGAAQSRSQTDHLCVVCRSVLQPKGAQMMLLLSSSSPSMPVRDRNFVASRCIPRNFPPHTRLTISCATSAGSTSGISPSQLGGKPHQDSFAKAKARGKRQRRRTIAGAQAAAETSSSKSTNNFYFLVSSFPPFHR